MTRCTRKGPFRQRCSSFHVATLTVPRYVEMLERQQAQLVVGLQDLYRRTLTRQGWVGPALQASGSGHPLTHDILEGLGALQSDGHGELEGFVEDLNALQQRLIDDGAGFTQRQDSGDSDSEHGQTPTSFLELPPPKPPFPNAPFSLTQLPPTPPMQTPYPRSELSSFSNPLNTSGPQPQRSQSITRTSMNPAALQNQTWATPIIYEENMNFTQQLEMPTACQGIAGDFNRQLMAMSTVSPRVAALEWNEDDFSAFLNPTIIA